TDYMMPEMDGMALITKLKSQLSTRFIPIIMLTAKDVDAEVEVINAGADDYLTKPVNPKRLIARINRLLNRPSIEAECSCN
ncbi:MAG: response regulator, partial [Deltaproteobacteria bacterium]